MLTETGNAIINVIQRIMQDIPEGVLICNPDNRVTFCNNTFAAMIASRPNEIIDASFLDFLADDKERKKATKVERTIDNACAMYDTVIKTQRGNRVAVRVYTSTFADDGTSTKRIIRIISDITKVKRAEHLNEHSRSLLAVYTHLFQHDLLNDLHVMLGYIDTVIMQTEELSPGTREMLEAAKSVGYRMAGIVGIFDNANTFKETDLIELIQRAINESKAAHVDLNIELRYDDESRPIVLATPLLLTAFHNLFRNAAQHAGVPVTVAVTIKSNGDSVEIIVEDDGVGIPPKKMKTLFMKKNEPHNHGIGLYLTKHIVLACGGSIEVVSGPNRGAMFRIILPTATY